MPTIRVQAPGGGYLTEDQLLKLPKWEGRPSGEHVEILVRLKNRWCRYFRAMQPKLELVSAANEREDLRSYLDTKSYMIECTPAEAVEWFKQNGRELPELLRGTPRTGETPSADPGSMAWSDGKKTHRFSQRVLYDLWTVLVSERRRFTFDQLRARIPRWKDSFIHDSTIGQHVKHLRTFWRNKKRNRPDLAKKITTVGGAVGFDVPKI